MRTLRWLLSPRCARRGACRRSGLYPEVDFFAHRRSSCLMLAYSVAQRVIHVPPPPRRRRKAALTRPCSLVGCLTTSLAGGLATSLAAGWRWPDTTLGPPSGQVLPLRPFGCSRRLEKTSSHLRLRRSPCPVWPSPWRGASWRLWRSPCKRIRLGFFRHGCLWKRSLCRWHMFMARLFRSHRLRYRQRCCRRLRRSRR